MSHPASEAIGVFDSGVGGLAILGACRAALPAEDFVYFGDTAYFPYGQRDPDEVRQRALTIARWLIGRGATLIVIACNTATAVAQPDLRRELAVPVVGVIEPEVRAAVRATRNLRVGLLATEATVRSGAYPRLLHALRADIRVTSVPCPRLAPAIQEDGQAVPDILAGCTAPLAAAGVDTVILGCTHFPAVAPLVRRSLPHAALIDGRREIVREVTATLSHAEPGRAPARPGRCRFACSGDPEAFRLLADRVLRMPVDDVEMVDPGRRP